MRFPVAIVVTSLVLAASLPAQKPDRDAARLDSLLNAPRPAIDADSNDLDALVAWGKERRATRRPGEAAVAFLWASRLGRAR